MNFNFSSFLNGSLRILNIANKTIPLIKEASPAIKNIKEKYNKFKMPQNTVKQLPYVEKNNIKKEVVNSNVGNLPTFFR